MAYLRKNIRDLIYNIAKEVDLANALAGLCKSSDERVKLEAVRLVLAYGYGRPKEQVEMSGSFDIHAVVAAARERVIRARTIPPSSIPKLIEAESGAARSHNLQGDKAVKEGEDLEGDGKADLPDLGEKSL